MSFGAPITCCSVLYKPGKVPAPKAACSVFELTPLAREMLLGCRAWGPEAKVHEPLAWQMFATLATLTQKLAEAPCNTWVPTGKSDALKRALGFTEARLEADITFEEVARAAHVSERTLARRFSDETGMTWRQVQRKMRMIRAMELLAEDTRVTEVSLAVGYSSQSAFNTAFKAFSGQSPTAFRRAGQ
jgi:AraC-like DNA-binding protein